MKAQKKGMTLVEVVVAMAIFGMIMVSVFPAFLMMNLTNIVSRENVAASFLAEDITERIYNYSNTINEADLVNTLIANEGFLVDGSSENITHLSKMDEHYKINLTLTFDVPTEHLVTVLVVIDSRNKVSGGKRSQVETIVGFGG